MEPAALPVLLEKESPDMTLIESAAQGEPRLLLAHSDIGFAALASRRLHRAGWDVYLARTGNEVRQLTKTVSPALVVLDTDLPDESGWLLCEKLSHEQPSPKVILVSDDLTPESSNFASFVGATALVHRQEGVGVLINEVNEAALSAASQP